MYIPPDLRLRFRESIEEFLADQGIDIASLEHADSTVDGDRMKKSKKIDAVNNAVDDNQAAA